MSIKKDELIIIGGIILIGGVVLFWKDIARALNLNVLEGGAPEMPFEEVDEEFEESITPESRFDKYQSLTDEDMGEDSNCKISFAKYADYYAIRVVEELDKNDRKENGISGNTKLEIKGRVLLSYKDEMKKMYNLNKKCVRALKGESRAIFIDIILRTADRLNVHIPSEKKADWKRLSSRRFEEIKRRYKISIRSYKDISDVVKCQLQ